MYVVISEASIGQIKLVQIIHSSRLLYILDVEMAMNDIYCPIRTRNQPIECDHCGFSEILWFGWRIRTPYKSPAATLFESILV